MNVKFLYKILMTVTMRQTLGGKFEGSVREFVVDK